MAHESKMNTILRTTIDLAAAGSGQVTVDDLSRALAIKTHVSHKRLLNTLSDLCRAGRIRRVRMGVYGPPVGQHKEPELRVRMWRIFRMRRRVTVADLMELTGVSEDYAVQWLRMLEKRGVAARFTSNETAPVWSLLNDSVEMPVDHEKAAKLRELRRRKKESLLQAVEDIEDACKKARSAIKKITEEEMAI